MLFSILTLMMTGSTLQHIEDTGIYQPLLPGEVHVSPDGDVWLLDFANATVLHFDANGQKKANIASKGEGPGEVKQPEQFFVNDKFLYIYDRSNGAISKYARNGKFIRRLQPPAQKLSIAKVTSGWIYGNWKTAADEEQPASIVWANEDFSQTRKLLEIKDPGTNSGLALSMRGSETFADFYPIPIMPKLVASPDGKFAFLAETNGVKIHVISGGDSSIQKVITQNQASVPFDREWGELRLQKAIEMLPAQYRSVKVESHFPERFPVIRELLVTSGNNLAVMRWAGNPDKNKPHLLFDSSGKTLSPDLDWTTLERIVGMNDQWAWVTVFDQEDEEAGILRCPRDQMQETIRKNPILYEGSSGRIFSGN